MGRTWTRKLIERLGVDTDTTIARELEISISAVAQRRRRIGIGRSPLARLDGRAWTSAEDALLVTMADREVARELGVSRWTVERRRLALGICGFAGMGRRARAADLVGAKYADGRRAGTTIAQIARKHVSAATVRKALERYQRRCWRSGCPPSREAADGALAVTEPGAA